MMVFGRISDEQRNAAGRWLDQHLDAPVVASVEGRVVGVRRECNHYSRQGWEARVATDAAFCELVTCPEITGLAPDPIRVASPRTTEVRPVQVRQQPVGRKTLPEKARQFKDAVLDLATGNVVDEETYQQRLTTCESNICGWLKRVPQKRWLQWMGEAAGLLPKFEGDGLLCDACSCPGWNPLAELHTKLRCPGLECPCEEPLWGKAGG